MTATDPLQTTRDSAQAFEDRLAFFATTSPSRALTHGPDGKPVDVTAAFRSTAEPMAARVRETLRTMRATEAEPDQDRLAARVAHGYQDEAR